MLPLMTKRKSQQIADLRAEHLRVGAEIASMREELAALEKRGSDLQSKIQHLEMSGRTRIGKPTLSDAIIRQVWDEIVRMTWGGKAVPAKDLYWALRSAVPGLRPGTLRVYMHRFREQGLLDRRGSAWYRMAPSEVRRRA